MELGIMFFETGSKSGLHCIGSPVGMRGSSLVIQNCWRHSKPKAIETVLLDLLTKCCLLLRTDINSIWKYYHVLFARFSEQQTELLNKVMAQCQLVQWGLMNYLQCNIPFGTLGSFLRTILLLCISADPCHNINDCLCKHQWNHCMDYHHSSDKH